MTDPSVHGSQIGKTAGRQARAIGQQRPALFHTSSRSSRVRVDTASSAGTHWRIRSLFDALDKPEETTAVKENAAEAAPLSRDGALKLRFSQALAIPPAL